MKPTITVIPNRSFNVSTSAATDTLDLLIRIDAPEVDSPITRPPLDVALVLDRSGSMGGLPLNLAKQAAKLILRELTSEDRMAVIAFDNTADVIFPLQKVGDIEGLNLLIDGIRVRGSTALYAGWRMAADLLLPEAGQGRLARVLLLTDGRANVGLRDPILLAAQLDLAQQQGVSTSTVGVGLKYDEHLLEALAGAGDGNYHFAERPDQLPDVFSTELLNLRAILGRRVSLGLQGADIRDALNDLPRLGNGRLALPPLRAGRSLDLLFRVELKQGDPIKLRLAWDDHNGERHRIRASFDIPAVPQAHTVQEDTRVIQLREHLLLARTQREVARLADVGDVGGAMVLLSSVKNRLLVEGMRSGINMQPELEQIATLEQRLKRGDRNAASKLARKQSYDKTTGREEQ